MTPLGKTKGSCLPSPAAGSLNVYTPDAFPLHHANTMHNMSIHRKAYKAAGCAKKMPFDDIPPAE